MNTLLHKAYDPESFRSQAHELIDSLADHLKQVQQDKISVNDWHTPEQELDFWKHYEIDNQNPLSYFNTIMNRSIQLHHPKYMGHQVSTPVPLSMLAGLLSSYLNNGMGIYEMGQSASALEKLVVRIINKQIGYSDEADGILTSGGTLANLTAMLAARSTIVDDDIWENGHRHQLAVMVSSEAHYCVDKALRIMGFGSDGVIKIPVDKNYKMRVDLLDEQFRACMKKNLQVIAVVGSAPTTSTGKYDDLDAIADFCEDKNIWFHVDGAHGGSVVYSNRYAHLVKGIHRADSIAIDGHKMMMTPGIMTFLLYKNKADSYKTFNQKAHYLWENHEDEDWYNYAKRTFECTKKMMSVQIYVLMKYYGNDLFAQNIEQLYDLAMKFADKILLTPNLELAVNPDSNIVCYRYNPGEKLETELNMINKAIRSQILQDNEFYIVQTLLHDKLFLRCTFMNVFTTEDILDALILKVLDIAEHILKG